MAMLFSHETRLYRFKSSLYLVQSANFERDVTK